MSKEKDVLIGAGAAVLFGAVVGGFTYAENMQSAEARNVGHEATDRVVACAEYLGDRAVNAEQIKASCDTASFVTSEQASDGTTKFTVKFPTSAEYLASFYDSAKAADAAAVSEASGQAKYEAVRFGAPSAFLLGVSLILISSAPKRKP